MSGRKVFYSVIAAGWGIFVGLEARLLEPDESVGQRVTGKVFPHEGYALLVKGLDLVDPGLRVHIEEISYNETDFQLEGLAMAMATWASEVTGRPMPEIPVFFDRAINQYVFDWPQA
jgi:hypothetical protein